MSESIGEQLRKARLEKQLSVENVAQALHIRVKYIEALETNRCDLLPSQVQAKGFLRLYAGFLGLSAQPLLDLLDGKTPPPPPPAPPAPPLPLPIGEGTEASFQPPTPQPVESAPTPSPLPEKSSEPSQLSFREIGRVLNERRNALNLTLEEVERFTHVRLHYLKALEEGRLEDLPSPVQGRGMLNNYAHFLNLDAEELLNNFAEGLQSRREERLLPPQKSTPGSPNAEARKPAKKRPAISSRWTRLVTPDLIIVGTVIIGLLLFAAWSASQVSSRQQANNQVTPLSIADVLLSSSPQAQLPTRSATPPPNIGTRQPQTAVSTQVGGATLALTGTVPITGSGALQIYIVATQRTYLRVTADNRIIYDERLVPGNAYAFAGDRTIEVLISNAAGVQIFYGQKDLGNLGVVGEVKRILFTREGVITPTLAFSATPSRTPLPSATLKPSPTAPTATITPFIP